MKVLVRCTIDIEVDVEGYDGEDGLDTLQFSIEENSCPGTGVVGAKLDEMRDRGERNSTCWACGYGKNEILAIDGKPWGTP